MSSQIDELLNEIRAFYQSLVAVGNELHEGSGISPGMRAVLEHLYNNGDRTVPRIARARKVTRQRIQSLADRLMAEDLVETRDNPASKRSPLLTLTAKGRKTIQRMRKREAQALQGADVRKTDVERAKQVLISLREKLEHNTV